MLRDSNNLEEGEVDGGGGGGRETLFGPIFRTFVRSRSHFSNYFSALYHIFKFIHLGHSFVICPLQGYQNEV